MPILTESTVEEAALELFESLGYTILHGPDIAPDGLFVERRSYGDVVLAKRLRDALTRINPKVSAEAIEEAIRKVQQTESPLTIFVGFQSVGGNKICQKPVKDVSAG